MKNAKRPIRILHIGKFYPPDRGGMESHLETLCQGLRSDFELDVIVSSKTSTAAQSMVDGIRVRRLATPLMVASAPINPSMVAAIRNSECDLIHLHHPNPMGMLALLMSRTDKPVVITYHSDIVRQRFLGRLIQPLTSSGLKRASAIIATSPNYVDSSPVLPAFRDRIRVIPLGIHLDAFDQDLTGAVASIRSRFSNRPIILAIGRCVYYKGFQFAVEAMQYVDGAHLVIVGDGPMREELSALANSIGAGDRVSIVGEVEDVQPYLKACDVFAFPSVARSEAFGIVQLEAMACRKPVVNTALDSGVPYVSLNGETGFTVPARDPVEFANALKRILNDAALARRLGEQGRERVEREFTAERMVERTAELYRSLCS